MPTRKHGRRLMIESLERRETPSAGLGGSIHEMVQRPRPIALTATGTAQYTSTTTGTVTVTGRNFGTLTGTLTVTSATTSTVVISNGAGTTLDLLIHGAFTKGKHPQFHGTLTATTGSEVNGVAVTGHGSVSGPINTATETLTFHLSGTLKA